MEAVISPNFVHTGASISCGVAGKGYYASHGKACRRGGVKWDVRNGGRCLHSLSWARREGSHGRGGGGLLHCSSKVVVGRAPHGSPTTTNGTRAAFTEKQEALVKDTWAILKKDAGHHALALFLTVFEIAPSSKRLFSFLKDSDVPIEKNPKLKSHALKVFVIICEAATSLRKKGEVSTPGSTMKDMANSHIISGVVDEHYEVVKFSLLKTVEKGLPAGMWNDEVKGAWAEAYDELVLAIKAEGGGPALVN